MKQSLNKTWILAALGALGLVGCGDTTRPPSVQAPAPSTEAIPLPKAQADAGLKVDPNPMAPDVVKLASAFNFGSRSNPFGLMAFENAFEQDQQSARFVSDTGFSVEFEEPEEREDDTTVRVPIPLWRLSGIMIGDSVAALLDTGTSVMTIRPGMEIPDTEWVVIAIDEDKATLRHKRANVSPREITVKIEPMILGGGGGAPGFGGGPAGGDDEGGPGGRPPGSGPAGPPGGGGGRAGAEDGK